MKTLSIFFCRLIEGMASRALARDDFKSEASRAAAKQLLATVRFHRINLKGIDG